MTFCMYVGPDGGWNPIDELSLPFDGDIIHETAVCIETNTNESLSKRPSSIAKNDLSMKSSLSEQEPSLHQNNLSIWKDKKDVPWENINKLTSNDSCDNINEIDCNTEIKHNESSENVIDNNRKIINDDLSLTSEQYICDLPNVKNNIIPQNLPNLVLQLNNYEVYENNEIYQPKSNVNYEKSTGQDILVNGHLECVDIEKSSSQTNCVQNVLLDNLKNDVSDTDTPNGMYAMLVENLSINNNNNNIMTKNDQEEYSDFCDFETDLPHSLNVPLPNRTSQEHHEIIENPQTVDQQHLDKLPSSQFNDEHCKILKNISTLVEDKIEQNVESVNPNCSTFQYNEINVEHNSDSKFDEFSGFHVFSTSTTKKKSICDTNDDNDDDFCTYETCKEDFNDTVELKHSNIDHVKCVNSNDSILKSENQSSIINNDDDDDNFCDFESGYTTSGLHISDQVIDLKQSYAILDSGSHVQLDYKQFCKDAFQGDYVSFFFY